MYPYYNMMYYGDGVHWLGFGIFGLVFFVLLWAIFIVIVVRLVRWILGGHKGREERWKRWHEFRGDSALNILNERYARGEINKEEYEQKKKDISGS